MEWVAPAIAGEDNGDEVDKARRTACESVDRPPTLRIHRIMIGQKTVRHLIRSDYSSGL